MRDFLNMKRQTILLPALILLALFWPGHLQANVVGSDAQNFNPITSGLDFVTVHSSETLEPGILNLGLFINFARNTFPFYPVTTSRNRDFQDHYLGGDFNFGLGLIRNWDIGISFPMLLDQHVDDLSRTGYFGKTGLTEIRANTKLRLIGNESQGIAVIGSANFNQIKNNPYSGSGGGPTFNLELAADTTIARWALAGNIGYRWRDPGAPITGTGIEPLPSQMIASIATSYLFRSIDTKLIFEIFSGFPANSDDLTTVTDREYSSYEALLGAKHDWTSNLAVHGGFGTELSQGVSSPDWRVYVGINWTLGPLWLTKEEQVVEPDKVPEVRVIEGVRVARVKNYEQISLDQLEFEFNTANLVPKSREYLHDVLIGILNQLNKERPISKIVIEGHTDSLGSRKVNQELSQFRADAVKYYLEKNLSFKPLIETIGYGEDEPVASNGNYQGRARNRRVEFQIYRD